MKDLKQWKTRANAAAEAMTVRALDLLGVETASHLVANVLSPYIMDPNDEELAPVLSALRDRVVLDRRFRADNPVYPHAYPSDIILWPLLEELARIWDAAHAGVDVSPDVLERLKDRVERGIMSEGDRPYLDDLGRSALGLTLKRAHGFWFVGFEVPSGRRIARGEHPMLLVAAELCWRRLTEHEETSGAEAPLSE